MTPDPMCGCLHVKSIHNGGAGVCWGQPIDLELSLCLCDKFKRPRLKKHESPLGQAPISSVVTDAGTQQRS